MLCYVMLLQEERVQPIHRELLCSRLQYGSPLPPALSVPTHGSPLLTPNVGLRGMHGMVNDAFIYTMLSYAILCYYMTTAMSIYFLKRRCPLLISSNHRHTSKDKVTSTTWRPRQQILHPGEAQGAGTPPRKLQGALGHEMGQTRELSA